MSQVSWSPDGSALLFIAVEELPGHDPEGVFVVGADGSGLRRLPISRLWGWPWPPARAVWSPDGYRVAVYGMGQALGGISPSVVVTITRDVTDMRFLARVDGGRDPRADGRFHAWNPSRSEEPVDPAACSRGFVVPDPESNPGLVSDCETLLTMRDTLAGSAELEWNEDMHIYEWDGVTVDGSPPRVHELALWQRGLRGRAADRARASYRAEAAANSGLVWQHRGQCVDRCDTTRSQQPQQTRILGPFVQLPEWWYPSGVERSRRAQESRSFV